MPRVTTLPRYIQPVAAGGVTYYYLRYRGSRIKLPDPSDRGFKTAYNEALETTKLRAKAVAAGHATAKAKKKEASWPGSTGAALDAYFADGINVNKRDGSRIAGSTAQLRRRALQSWHSELAEEFGSIGLTEITGDAIEELLKKTAKAGNNGKARTIRTALRSFFDYCKSQKLIETDPAVTLNVKLAASSEDGWPMWEDDQINAYLAHHKAGTEARYMYDLFYSSGAACADLCRLSRKNIIEGCWEYTRLKTSEQACKPASAEMMAQIEQRATALGNVVPLTQPLLLKKDGFPYTAQQLSKRFSAYVAEAGIEQPQGAEFSYSAHGLRKRAACDDLDRGDCSFDEMMAMYGWRTAAMVIHYGKKYSRRNAARRVAQRRAGRV
jgi:site-specific recombinase XerD